MSKLMLGLLAGAVLGFFDGLTAWFEPAGRDQLLGIGIGSTVQRLLTGLAAGWVAKKYNSMMAAVLVGLGVGFVLSYGVAAMPGNHYYLQIVLPGSILGLIVGFASQRFGRASPRTA